MDAFSGAPYSNNMRFAWQEKNENHVCLGHKYGSKSETPCQREWFWTGKPENQLMMRNAMGKNGGLNWCWEEVFFAAEHQGLRAHIQKELQWLLPKWHQREYCEALQSSRLQPHPTI